MNIYEALTSGQLCKRPKHKNWYDGLSTFAASTDRCAPYVLYLGSQKQEYEDETFVFLELNIEDILANDWVIKLEE